MQLRCVVGLLKNIERHFQLNYLTPHTPIMQREDGTPDGVEEEEAHTIPKLEAVAMLYCGGKKYSCSVIDYS